MNLSLSDEQRQLRDMLAAFLADNYSFEQRTAASRSEIGWRTDIWRAFADQLGILSLCLPERLGGLEDRTVETMVVMEELGAALVLEPFLETVVLAGGLLARAGGHAADVELERIASGDSVCVFAWSEPQSRFDFADIATCATVTANGWRIDGAKSIVSAAPWATRFIVSARIAEAANDDDGLSLFLVDRDTPGLSLTPYRTIDGRAAAELLFDGAALPADSLLGTPGAALPLIEAAVDEAIAAIGAEGVGVIRRMLRDTIDYTRQRRQFGQSLADFQALQHRMVDMFIQSQNATSAAYLAVINLDAPPVERSRAVSAAKATIGDACRLVGQSAVQLHGGMGMADELALGHYFRRATVIESEFGSSDHHRARFASLADKG